MNDCAGEDQQQFTRYITSCSLTPSSLPLPVRLVSFRLLIAATDISTRLMQLFLCLVRQPLADYEQAVYPDDGLVPIQVHLHVSIIQSVSLVLTGFHFTDMNTYGTIILK
jgi:hypothetical protein